MHKGGSGSGTSRGVVVVGKDGGVKVWFQGGVSHLFAVLLHYLVTMCLLSSLSYPSLYCPAFTQKTVASYLTAITSLTCYLTATENPRRGP